jgi:hypothetical protein
LPIFFCSLISRHLKLLRYAMLRYDEANGIVGERCCCCLWIKAIVRGRGSLCEKLRDEDLIHSHAVTF